MRFANTVSSKNIVIGFAALLVALPLLHAQQRQQQFQQRAAPAPQTRAPK